MHVLSQVLWLGQSEVRATWENAEILPPAAIHDFENGINSQVSEEHCEAYGMNRSTFTATSCIPNAPKRPCTERPILETTTG